MNHKTKKWLRKILISLLGLILVVTVIAAGIYLWAYLSTGTSLLARGIMWGDSDAGDLYRFPTRQMQASVNPVRFEPVAEDILSQLPISDKRIQAVDMPFATFLEMTNSTAGMIVKNTEL